MKQVTKKQLQVLECIQKSIEKNGYPPSVREIGAAVGLSSPSTVHSHLHALEKAGLIKRAEGKTRSITLTELAAEPEGIPILGTVAAGEPILAVEDAIGYINYDTGSEGEFFALKIKGDSMINAGILDGDMVIVRRQPSALNGEIVIALIDDSATCKRLKRENGKVLLLPENDAYSPIEGDNASLLGKVTAVIRRYS
ncbi:MAG: transcriptional repressor LexA [Papillibacter sp.]|jgi:repressor LexA|nr:transcriptional repressor LexA [Papillibacter sp.]